jgi:hypothetical protein
VVEDDRQRPNFVLKKQNGRSKRTEFKRMRRIKEDLKKYYSKGGCECDVVLRNWSKFSNRKN